MKAIKILKIFILGAFALGALICASSCSDDSDSIPFHTSRLHSFGPSPAERGGEITILGDGLDKVKEVIFPVDVRVSEFSSKTSDKIVLSVPQDAVPGQIRLVMNDGEIVTSRSTISFAEEIEIKTVTPTTLNVGEKVTVTGEYLYNIASIIFANGYEITSGSFESQTCGELTFKVPAEAASGKITFSNGGEWEEQWETPLTVSSSITTEFAPSIECDFGAELKAAGTSLNLIDKIIFPGQTEGYFESNAEGTSITVTVPNDTKSGEVTATLFNGDNVALFIIALPEISYTSISPASNVAAGTKLTIAGHLLDRVKEIKFPGAGSALYGNWTVGQDGTTLQVDVPAGIVDGKLTLVQNSQIKVETDAISTRKTGNVFWTGNIDFGNWSGYLQVASECNDDVWRIFNSTIKTTGTLTLNFTEDESSTWWQFQPVYRTDWVTTFAECGHVDLAQGATSVQVRVTQTDLDMMHDAGWAFKGCFITLQSIEWAPDGGATPPVDPERPGDVTTIWTGKLALDGSWSATQQIPAADFATLKTGDSLVFAYTIPGSGNAQIKPMDGSWTPLSVAEAANQWACIDLDDSGTYTMPLTDNDISMLQASGMILGGQHVTVTSVAIK